jgi:hypothetical protein
MQWSDIPRDPPARQLRIFAGILLAVSITLVAWHGLPPADKPLLWLLLIAATGVSLVGLVRSRAIRWVFVGWLMAVYPIGWLVSHVLLAIVYYGFITPLGLCFRIFGRDVLHCKRPSGIESYWQPKPAPQGLQSYFRQF